MVSCLAVLAGDPPPGCSARSAKPTCENTKVANLLPLKGMLLETIHCDFKPERDTQILRFIKTLVTIQRQAGQGVLEGSEREEAVRHVKLPLFLAAPGSRVPFPRLPGPMSLPGFALHDTQAIEATEGRDGLLGRCNQLR